MMLGTKALGVSGVGFDRVSDLEPLMAERSLHQKAAPAAEADDRRVYHDVTPDVAGRRRIASITKPARRPNRTVISFSFVAANPFSDFTQRNLPVRMDEVPNLIT